MPACRLSAEHNVPVPHRTFSSARYPILPAIDCDGSVSHLAPIVFPREESLSIPRWRMNPPRLYLPQIPDGAQLQKPA